MRPMMELNTLLKFDGVYAAIIVEDGIVREKAGLPGADTTGLATSLSLLLTESGMVANRLRNGPLTVILIEFENRLLLIKSLEDNRFLAVITRRDANIGQINYCLRSYQAKQGAGA
jgi:predicted regulator of Ras-like GTPase activity (Roadblock/LC7/MglB family)